MTTSAALSPSTLPLLPNASAASTQEIERVPMPKPSHDWVGRGIAGAGAGLGVAAYLAGGALFMGVASPLVLGGACALGAVAAVQGYRNPRAGMAIGVGVIAAVVSGCVALTLLAPAAKGLAWGAAIVGGMWGTDKGAAAGVRLVAEEGAFPDYGTPWQAGRVREVGRNDNGIYVVVGDYRIEGLVNVTEVVKPGAWVAAGTPLGLKSERGSRAVFIPRSAA